jgi:hypothetical protein
VNRLILTLAFMVNLGLSACDNSAVASLPSNNMDIGKTGTVESLENESAKGNSGIKSDTLVQGEVDGQVNSGVRDDEMVKDDDGVSASSVQPEESRTLKLKEI